MSSCLIQEIEENFGPIFSGQTEKENTHICILHFKCYKLRNKDSVLRMGGPTFQI